MADVAPDDQIRVAVSRPFGIVPGSKFKYSNTNDALLVWMLTSVTGRGFEETMLWEVVSPLGLANTYQGR